MKGKVFERNNNDIKTIAEKLYTATEIEMTNGPQGYYTKTTKDGTQKSGAFWHLVIDGTTYAISKKMREFLIEKEVLQEC